MHLRYVHGRVRFPLKLQIHTYKYMRIMVLFTNEREVIWFLGYSRYTMIQVVIPFLPIYNTDNDKKDKEN
jgi:hypothetical protein